MSPRVKPPAKFPRQADQQRSPFYWWWRYLRKNSAYLKCCDAGGRGSLSRLYADFGDVRDDDFWQWWSTKMSNGQTRGEYLFAKPPRETPLGFVKRLESVKEWDDSYERHGYVLLAVNLGLESRSDIRKQLLRWLRDEPAGPNFLSLAERRYRNQRRKKDGLPPLPLSQSGRRGRPRYSRHETGARYILTNEWSVPRLRECLAIYEAREQQIKADEEQRQISARLLAIRRDLVLRRTRSKKYIELEGEAVSREAVRRLYREAATLLTERNLDLDVLVKGFFQGDTRNRIDRRLDELFRRRRSVGKTSMRKLGLRSNLLGRGALVESFVDRAQDASSNAGRSMSRAVTRRYKAAQRLIDNTINGVFPETDLFLEERKAKRVASRKGGRGGLTAYNARKKVMRRRDT